MYQILAVSTSSITSRAFSDKNIDDEFILRNYVVTFDISVGVTFGRIHVFCRSWSQWDKKQTERVPKFLNSIFFINKWRPKIFNWEEIPNKKSSNTSSSCVYQTDGTSTFARNSCKGLFQNIFCGSIFSGHRVPPLIARPPGLRVPCPGRACVEGW